jgi:glycosyltransferase involved in cell wall biosynthesis
MMAPEPAPATITTIIPTFDRARLLRRAVLSALAQTHRDIRVCVYDNASTDETPQVVAALQETDSRVMYHRHQKNIGSIANFSFGMRNVRTRYFSVLSDDDILLPRFYETVLEGFRLYPEAVFSAGSVIQTTPDGEVRHVPFASWPRMGLFRPPEGLRVIVGGNHPTITGILFRSDVVLECGTFDPHLTIGDVDYEIRIASRFPFVVSADPVALFVPHRGSESERLDLATLSREYLAILGKLERDPNTTDDTRRMGAERLRSYLRMAIRGHALRALARGAPGDASTAAEVLARNLDGPGAALLVRSLAALCRLPFAGRMFSFAYSTARAARDDRTLENLRQHYGSFGQCLRSD